MNNSKTGHPLSLRVFFATEMGERYGYYVVQTLLAIYVINQFRWDDNQVYALVGSFTAMTYLSPIVGGWIADNLIGQKKTIIVGAVCLLFSYVALTFVTTNLEIIATLSAIAVGTGLLKPNISSLLGNEYPVDSPKRESGFTIFYMGITTGIILGTILPSYLKAQFGWPIAFMSAAIGMVIATLIFVLGIKKYNIADYHPFEHHIRNKFKAGGMMLGLWILSFYILYNPQFANLSFGLVVLFAFSYLFSTAKREIAEQRNRTIVIGLLCIISILFWAFYFQMFLSITLFITRTVKPDVFGFAFPAPYYVGVQSIGMLIFGYFISRSKPSINSVQSGIRASNKFLLSMGLMVIAFAIITYSCYGTATEALISPFLLMPAYLMISIAELLLSPVGLAAVTTLANRRKVSTMMGIFFVSLGIGGFLSGKLAYLTAIDTAGLSIHNLKLHYFHSFSLLLTILIIAALFCILLNRIIKKLL